MNVSGFVFVFTVSSLLGVDSSFNLYIGVEEVKTLLGLSNELYYVREGVPNIYALQFTIPVPPHVDALHFTWQALGQKPLPYTTSMEFSESAAMIKPSLNISSKGIIPMEPQIFQIFFPCTGATSEEVHFEFTINVTTTTHLKTINTTSIVLRRRRICLKDSQKITKTEPGFHKNSRTKLNNTAKTPGKTKINADGKGVELDHNSEDDISEFGHDSTWIYILSGTLIGLLIILIVLAFVAYGCVRNKNVSKTAEFRGFLNIDTSGTESSTSCGSASGGNLFTRPDPESPHHYSSVSPSDLYSNSSYYRNALPIYSEISSSNTCKSNSSTTQESLRYGSKVAEIRRIERCKIRLQSVIIEGSFTRIYDGTFLEKDGAETRVTVKTVLDGTSPLQISFLLEEGLRFAGIRQQHVSTIIGIASEDKVPPFLVYGDEGFQNLKKFLQHCRSGCANTISTQEVIHMIIQIGSGIAFLHGQNIIHGDVAARNCIVDGNLMVKVCDSALSSDLFSEDYYPMGDIGTRPIKWSPPEVITHNNYSQQADMWSFGVLLWELFTLAQQPYAEIESNQLLIFLSKGYRLAQPFNCPDESYSTMTKCWTWNANDRPKWSRVLPQLQDLHAQLHQFV